MVFGDPAERHHAEALALSSRTEEAMAEVLCRDERLSAEDAALRARTISAVMFLTMAATINVARTIDDLMQDIEGQVRALLPA